MYRLAGLFLIYALRAEKALTVFAFIVMTLVIVGDVISRKVTGLGIIGAPRIAVFAMIVTAFASFGLASDGRRHLRPKFADQWFPAAWDPVITRIQELLTASFCLAFAGVAIGVVQETYALQEVTRMLQMPVWPMQALIPLVFLVAGIRHAIYGLYLDLRPQLEANPSLSEVEGIKQ
ncbi:TRAP transporter small permease [Temperatibacter marinus]|uniref:TRAP transporter small permease protein n=1 Tax=Temperatibacter marinus TaxID=1456591 RepID=A0AA52H9S6_9PROT|nr:TRAP transporter small permease [Temperatibacter marinus]WND03501.1 TRAP transporter small permease [Temperatibacter marinus]